MAVGALTKSCAKMLDCTKSTDDTFTLDALPGVTCWEGEHLPMAALGAVHLLRDGPTQALLYTPTERCGRAMVERRTGGSRMASAEGKISNAA